MVEGRGRGNWKGKGKRIRFGFWILDLILDFIVYGEE